MTGSLWLAPMPMAVAASGETAAIDLYTAVSKSLSQPRTLARADAGGLRWVENADSQRFAPSLQSDIHHADGAGIPVSSTVGLDATTISLELSQPLYRSGHTRAQAQTQDSRLRAEQADKKLQLQRATSMIINTYLDTQREDAQLKLMREMNMSAEAIAAKETNLAFLRQDLQELSGIGLETTLLPVSTPNLLPHSLRAALTIMEDKHPALTKAVHECAAAEAASRSLAWGQEPGLDLRGALDRTVDIFADTPEEESGMIGLRATIPFLGETESKTRKVQARESAEDGRQNIDAVRLALRQEVIAAWDELMRAQEDVDFQQHKARLARAAAAGDLPADSTLGRTKVDTLTFKKLAQQAELGQIAARYAVRKAEFGLLTATGQLLDSLNATDIARDDRSANYMQNNSAFRLTSTAIQDPLQP